LFVVEATSTSSSSSSSDNSLRRAYNQRLRRLLTLVCILPAAHMSFTEADQVNHRHSASRKEHTTGASGVETEREHASSSSSSSIPALNLSHVRTFVELFLFQRLFRTFNEQEDRVVVARSYSRWIDALSNMYTDMDRVSNGTDHASTLQCQTCDFQMLSRYFATDSCCTVCSLQATLGLRSQRCREFSPSANTREQRHVAGEKQ
jgi:hypothetical protein